MGQIIIISGAQAQATVPGGEFGISHKSTN